MYVNAPYCIKLKIHRYRNTSLFYKLNYKHQLQLMNIPASEITFYYP